VKPVHLLLLSFTTAACGGAPSQRAHFPSGDTRAQAVGDVSLGAAVPSGKPPDQTGVATWYGDSFAGRRTSNGERFDPNAMTAAHRSLPFGTWVEVRRVDNGRVVRVRINDRGPWGNERRIIDVSRAAAEQLDLVAAGVARVEVRVVRGP